MPPLISAVGRLKQKPLTVSRGKHYTVGIYFEEERAYSGNVLLTKSKFTIIV